MTARTRSLFISHTWSFGDQYEKLCKLLDQASDFSYKNYLVPPDDPIHDAGNLPRLYSAIRNQMEPCHVVLIMAGMYATFSKWIEAEIAIAGREFRVPKPIVAVRPWSHAKVSYTVEVSASKLVDWSADSIVSAILEVAP